MTSENYNININRFNLPFSAQQAYAACLEAMERLDLFRSIKGDESMCQITALSKDIECDEILVLKVISFTSSSCEIEMRISDKFVHKLRSFDTKIQNIDDLIKLIKNEICGTRNSDVNTMEDNK
ncbi:MAG: hypothetical protein K2J78_05640, partial [Muribaculaceae bacterium]|nr:hypothetical protein [Muribaculaceae bacterium]